MSEPCVLCDIHEDVAHITLNRANRRNALTRAMIVQLNDTLREVIADDQVRVIVLAAAGPVFCAGMDLAEMQQRAAENSGAKEWLQDAIVYRNLLVTLLDAPQPTLAVLQGPVLAGGVGIVLACDLVLASDKAFFSLPEIQRGITAAMVAPLLIYRAGAGNASHLLLSGRQVSATEMSCWGVCHEVVAPEQLDQAETEWINSILKGAPQALATTKARVRVTVGTDLVAQLDEAARLSAQVRNTEEAREGLQAFLKKRDPHWAKPYEK